MNQFPTVSKAAANSEAAPAVRVLRWIAGLFQLVSVLMIAAPSLATVVTTQFGVEGAVREGLIRAAGIALFVVTTLARILLPGGRRRHRSERVISELAGSTGGTFTVEPRGLEKSGWSGGPTARWTLEGQSVALQQFQQSNGSAVTRWSATFTSPNGLRFTVLPRNVLTRLITSTKFVGMLQEGVKQPDGELTEQDRAHAVAEIGILGGAEVTLGHALLDEKIIVKSNDADLARRVLTGRGVAERLNELNVLRKSWTLSLNSAEGGGTKISLELPRNESQLEPLKAGMALFEALLASLGQNGVLAAGDARERRAAH